MDSHCKQRYQGLVIFTQDISKLFGDLASRHPDYYSRQNLYANQGGWSYYQGGTRGLLESVVGK